MKNVLILKSGTANPTVSGRLGDYDRWFVQTLGAPGHRFEVAHAYLGQKLPRAQDYDALIMTGSPLSVTDLAPWMLKTAEYLREAADAGMPVLGVCFGHQLLAHAYGGTVRKNANGREIGTITCALTDAGAKDPLFDGITPRFEVQATHEDIVDEWPDEVELLASNANTTNQAFRVGRNVRAVQFHPEIDAATMKALIEARTRSLEAEATAKGVDPKERVRSLYAGIRATPHGPKILANFIRHFA